jgi:hypothetical protein
MESSFLSSFLFFFVKKRGSAGRTSMSTAFFSLGVTKRRLLPTTTAFLYQKGPIFCYQQRLAASICQIQSKAPSEDFPGAAPHRFLATLTLKTAGPEVAAPVRPPAGGPGRPANPAALGPVQDSVD